jgi:16S rRNA (uracil1498-N3)-methyltransferase
MERGTTRRARVFCPAVERDVATLSPDETHHIARVLRLRTGDAVIVFDGTGREWAGTLIDVARAGARIALTAPLPIVAEPSVAVTVAIGLLKGDAMSEVVRDAAMLGASAIVPFVSSHTALPAAASRARHHERWHRVAVASAKQCARSVVPTIHDVTTFADILGATYDIRIICVEPSAGVGVEAGSWPAARTALLLAGPEGGWSREEIDQARAAGAIALGLGPRTLRAESTPAIALTALWCRWGWQ